MMCEEHKRTDKELKSSRQMMIQDMSVRDGGQKDVISQGTPARRCGKKEMKRKVQTLLNDVQLNVNMLRVIQDEFRGPRKGIRWTTDGKDAAWVIVLRSGTIDYKSCPVGQANISQNERSAAVIAKQISGTCTINKEVDANDIWAELSPRGQLIAVVHVPVREHKHEHHRHHRHVCPILGYLNRPRFSYRHLSAVIVYSDVFDSTKGYPGEGPPPAIPGNVTVHILYSEIFDSTKGYPGEGPPPAPPQTPQTPPTAQGENANGNVNRRTKKQGTRRDPRKQRGDTQHAWSLGAWGRTTTTAIGQMMATGDDLFWEPPRDELDWANMRGCIASLNTRGWANDCTLQRRATWEQLASMRAMVVAIVDHRRIKANTSAVEYEVAEQWVGNTDRKCKPLWVHAPAKTNKIGGVTMGIHPALRRYAHATFTDSRGWGRYVGVEIRGESTANRTGYVVIIAVYGPCHSDGDDSMWKYQERQMDKLEEEERAANPQFQFVRDVTAEIAKYRNDGAEVVVVGDTNINYHKKEPIHREWHQALQQLQMENSMVHRWPDLVNGLHTWKNGESKSWIDHIWLSSSMTRDGALLRAGVEQVGGIHGSDHSLIAAEINWSTLIGRTAAQAQRHEEYPRFLRCTNETHKEMFSKIFSERDMKRYNNKQETMIIQKVGALLTRAREIRRGGSGREREALQKQMDETNDVVTKELLAVEQIMQQKNTAMMGKKSRNHWSYWMAPKMKTMRLLEQIIRMGRIKTHRAKVLGILTEIWARTSEGLAHKRIIRQCPVIAAPRREWVAWVHEVEEALGKMQKTLSARDRRKNRMKMNANVNKREEQAKLSASLKKFLNYALKRKGPEPKQMVVMERKDNSFIIHDTKPKVEKIMRQHTKTHMGENRERWYLNDRGEILPEFANTPHGRQWRKKLAQGTLTQNEWRCIPLALRGVFEHARAVENKKGERMHAGMYGDIFTSEIPIEAFERYVSYKKKNTAPGVSHIRIDHIAALSETYRQMICDMLSVVYITGMGYTAWKKEIANWVPKEEGNHDLTKQRPLMYYEVMRKMCIGIKKREVLKVWTDNDIIDKDNYAFLPGFDTSDPLMIKKMVLEDAQFFNKKLTLLDVDFSKAYDSTEKFAKDISLRRMGFPKEGLDMWQMYDDNRDMHVLTAYGLTDPVHPECGAWGQGAEESPYGWLCLMCWLSAYVDEKSPSPYKYTVSDNVTIKINKTIYADDGNYMSRSRTGGQTQADGISAFCASTGIIAKPEKSYEYSNDPEAETKKIHFTVYGGDGSYGLRELEPVMIKQLNENDYFKHLGNIQNAKGDTTMKSVGTYDGTIHENIYTKTQNNINTLVGRKISITAANKALYSVIIPQIMYPATFNNMSAKEIEQLQVLVRKVFRKKMKGRARNLPNVIIHGHEDFGGMGVSELADLINAQRLKVLERFLQGDRMSHYIAVGAIHRLRLYAKTDRSPLTQAVCGYIDPAPHMWLYHLKQWMEQHEITMTYEADYHAEPHTIDGKTAGRCPGDRGVIGCLKYEKHKRQVWHWLTDRQILLVSDVVGPDGSERSVDMTALSADALADVRQCVKETKKQMQTSHIQDKCLYVGMPVQRMPHADTRWARVAYTHGILDIWGKIQPFLERNTPLAMVGKKWHSVCARARVGVIDRIDHHNRLVHVRAPRRQSYKRARHALRTEPWRVSEVSETNTTAGAIGKRWKSEKNIAAVDMKHLDRVEITEEGEQWIQTHKNSPTAVAVVCSDGSVDVIHTSSDR